MILSFGREATTDDRNTERPPSTRQSTNVLLPLEICVLGLRGPIPYVGQHERQEEDATRPSQLRALVQSPNRPGDQPGDCGGKHR